MMILRSSGMTFRIFFTCFKHAGYATRWYTNQETEGLNSVEYLFGRTAQEIQTPQGRKNGVIEPIGYDEKNYSSGKELQ